MQDARVGCHGQGVSDAEFTDCRNYRLQQYFCVARCISFVREDAPSSQISYRGTCAQPVTVNPLTGGGGAGGSPTSAAAADGSQGEPCKSTTDFSGMSSCCTKDTADDFFNTDDIQACAGTDVKFATAVAHEYLGHKALNDSGAFDGTKITSYLLALDCLMRKFDLYTTKTKYGLKDVSAYINENVIKKSYKTVMQEIMNKCNAALKSKGDDLQVGEITLNTVNFMFFMCMRKSAFVACVEGSTTASKQCRATLEVLKKCDVL